MFKTKSGKAFCHNIDWNRFLGINCRRIERPEQQRPETHLTQNPDFDRCRISSRRTDRQIVAASRLSKSTGKHHHHLNLKSYSVLLILVICRWRRSPDHRSGPRVHFLSCWIRLDSTHVLGNSLSSSYLENFLSHNTQTWSVVVVRVDKSTRWQTHSDKRTSPRTKAVCHMK